MAGSACETTPLRHLIRVIAIAYRERRCLRGVAGVSGRGKAVHCGRANLPPGAMRRALVRDNRGIRRAFVRNHRLRAYSGLRFSLNAATPSACSHVRERSIWASASRRSAARNASRSSVIVLIAA